jgi:hypothetical protein
MPRTTKADLALLEKTFETLNSAYREAVKLAGVGMNTAIVQQMLYTMELSVQNADKLRRYEYWQMHEKLHPAELAERAEKENE